MSSTPNLRFIVQNLLQDNGYPPVAFHNDSQAIVALRDLLLKLKEDGGHILLVLDDVWPGAESLLEEFISIKLPGYKILVTTRSEFPSFGPTYRLKPLGDEDAKILLALSRPQPIHSSTDEHENQQVLFSMVLYNSLYIPLSNKSNTIIVM